MQNPESDILSGLFWTPSQPEQPYGGQLLLSESSLPILELAGRSHSLTKHVGNSPPSTVRLFGLSLGRKLTLEACHVVDWPMIQGSFSTYRLIPSAVIIGAHLEDCDQLSFRSMSVEFRNLADWIRPMPTLLGGTTPAGEETQSEEIIEFDSPRSKNIARLIYWPHEQRARSDAAETTTTDRHPITIQFNAAVSLQEIESICERLQSLFTALIGGPAAIARLTAEPVAAAESDSTEADHIATGPLPVELHLLLGHRVEFRRTPPIPWHRMLYPSGDVDLLDAVDRWLHLPEEYSDAMDALLEYFDLPARYEHYRLLTACSGIETLYRPLMKKSKNNQPGFRKRLTELVEYAGEPFTEIIRPAEDSWAGAVKKARNLPAHREKSTTNVPIRPSLHILARTAHLLLVHCLLKRAGIPETTLNELPASFGLTEIKNERGSFIYWDA